MTTLNSTADDVVEYAGRAEVLDYFAQRAADVDGQVQDVRPGLRMLGERGLLDLGAPENAGGELPTMLQVVEDVAAGCMSSAFALWAQRMVIEYLHRAESGESGARVLSALRSGEAVGATAMAPAMRHVAGLEPVPVVAVRSGGGVRLDGPIRWASNLFDGAVVVVPARCEDGGGVVVRLRTDTPGVAVNTAPDLLALGSTASSSMRLDGVEVPADAVLSEDLTGFVRSFRPTFLLVQSAFCSGLAGASREQASSRVRGLNEEFAPDLADLEERHDSVRRRLLDHAGAPERAADRDLLRLRLDAARVASDATRLEAAVTGGAGYVAGSATSRRLREAAFLPIQAPTEGQLRWELSRSA